MFPFLKVYVQKISRYSIRSSFTKRRNQPLDEGRQKWRNRRLIVLESPSNYQYTALCVCQLRKAGLCEGDLSKWYHSRVNLILLDGTFKVRKAIMFVHARARLNLSSKDTYSNFENKVTSCKIDCRSYIMKTTGKLMAMVDLWEALKGNLKKSWQEHHKPFFKISYEFG